MEKYLLGVAAPSLLPTGAGLGTASIDFDSGSMEISSREAQGMCADPATKSLHQPATQQDPTPGSALGISSVSPAAAQCPESPAAVSPLCHRQPPEGDITQPVPWC